MLQWLVKYLRLHRSSQIFTGVVDYFDLDYESEASCPRCSMACQFCLTAWQKVCVLKESLCLNCLNMFEHVWKPLVPSCLILVLSRFLFFFLPQGKDLDPFGARHKQNVSKCRMFAQPRGPLPVASGAHRWKFNHSIVMIVMYRIQIHSNSLFLLKSHDSMTQASGQDSFPISWFSRTCLILKGIFQQVKGKRKTLKFSELHHIHQHILKTATDCYRLLQQRMELSLSSSFWKASSSSSASPLLCSATSSSSRLALPQRWRPSKYHHRFKEIQRDSNKAFKQRLNNA